MNKRYVLVFTALLAGGALCASGYAGEGAYHGAGHPATGSQAQQDSARPGQTEQESQFKSVADLDGMPIRNMQGEQLGQIDQVLVDMNEGRLAFAVIAAAEAGDAAGQDYIVPWQMLQTTPQQDGLMVNVSSVSQLHPIAAGAPIGETLNRRTGGEIFQFYGMSPYWEEAGQQMQMEMPHDRMHQQMMEQMPNDPHHRQMMERMQQPERQPIPPTRP